MDVRYCARYRWCLSITFHSLFLALVSPCVSFLPLKHSKCLIHPCLQVILTSDRKVHSVACECANVLAGRFLGFSRKDSTFSFFGMTPRVVLTMCISFARKEKLLLSFLTPRISSINLPQASGFTVLTVSVLHMGDDSCCRKACLGPHG